MLENRAAELERLLGRVAPEYAAADDGTGQFPTLPYGGTGGHDGAEYPWYRAIGEPGYPSSGQPAADHAAQDTGGFAAATPPMSDQRTEVLINRGRHNAPKHRHGRRLRHWRAIGIAAACAAAGAFGLTLFLPGGSPSWPSSVKTVQAEITAACQNPNVVAEPTQVNFACAKGTRQILWVFALLTSGDKAAFSDSHSGRKGLEPITPAQGGDIAWSLNLHHPYNPANPTDSLQVAARAINNIIGGATLTGSNGTPVVEPGLESNPANCERYTGSSALVTRQGYPAVCAQPVTTAGGQAALVSDVFEQWMVGTPSRIAAEAGVLFENYDNPGDSRVQAILNSLPDSRL